MSNVDVDVNEIQLCAIFILIIEGTKKVFAHNSLQWTLIGGFPKS